MSVGKKAMVMAAGLGLRMCPLTDHLPKPLIKVAGIPLIDRTLDWLAASGIEEAVVNCHYRAEQIESHLATRTSPRIRISHEETLLETGGGVKKALPLLGQGAFFATNSDAICLDGKTPALDRLRARWDDENMDMLLLVQPREKATGHRGPGDFFVDADGALTRRGDAAAAPFVFTGIELIHPRVFRDAPEGAFSLNVLWDRLLAQSPERIRALVHDGKWLDVGDPQGLAAAEAEF